MVPRPGAENEDDGAVLVDVSAPACAFVVVLDLRSLREVCRWNLPYRLPLGFSTLWVPSEHVRRVEQEVSSWLAFLLCVVCCGMELYCPQSFRHSQVAARAPQPAKREAGSGPPWAAAEQQHSRGAEAAAGNSSFGPSSDGLANMESEERQQLFALLQSVLQTQDGSAPPPGFSYGESGPLVPPSGPSMEQEPAATPLLLRGTQWAAAPADQGPPSGEMLEAFKI